MSQGGLLPQLCVLAPTLSTAIPCTLTVKQPASILLAAFGLLLPLPCPGVRPARLRDGLERRRGTCHEKFKDTRLRYENSCRLFVAFPDEQMRLDRAR